MVRVLDDACPVAVMSVLWLVLGALACYRLTRLVTADQITLPLRTWVLDRSTWFGYLVTCDWCLSIWIAPWITAGIMFHGEHLFVQAPIVALSVSAITGLLSMIESRLDFQ